MTSSPKSQSDRMVKTSAPNAPEVNKTSSGPNAIPVPCGAPRRRLCAAPPRSTCRRTSRCSAAPLSMERDHKPRQRHSCGLPKMKSAIPSSMWWRSHDPSRGTTRTRGRRWRPSGSLRPWVSATRSSSAAIPPPVDCSLPSTIADARRSVNRSAGDACADPHDGASRRTRHHEWGARASPHHRHAGRGRPARPGGSAPPVYA